MWLKNGLKRFNATLNKSILDEAHSNTNTEKGDGGRAHNGVNLHDVVSVSLKADVGDIG